MPTSLRASFRARARPHDVFADAALARGCARLRHTYCARAFAHPCTIVHPDLKVHECEREDATRVNDPACANGMYVLACSYGQVCTIESALAEAHVECIIGQRHLRTS
eukprot:6184388-Pleurochrysis_carterae.AAC.1